jgi:hypothetical protein
MAGPEVKAVGNLLGTRVSYAYAVKAGPWIFLNGHEAFDFESGIPEEVAGPGRRTGLQRTRFGVQESRDRIVDRFDPIVGCRGGLGAAGLGLELSGFCGTRSNGLRLAIRIRKNGAVQQHREARLPPGLISRPGRYRSTRLQADTGERHAQSTVLAFFSSTPRAALSCYRRRLTSQLYRRTQRPIGFVARPESRGSGHK